MSVSFFCFGAALASFLNLCVYRIEQGSPVQGILAGRSFCESCKKKLQWYELVPIFSFIFLRGKCSGCKKGVNPFNFFSETLLGLAFAFFFYFSLPIPFFIFLIALYFFASYDFNYSSIPKKITDVFFILTFFYWILSLIFFYDINRVYPVLIFLIFSFVFYIASFKKMLFGFGDFMVVGMLAFCFELEIFLSTLFFSFVVGAFFSILLVLKDKSFLKKYIPFLPFVLIGYLISTLLYSLEVSPFDYIYIMW